MRENPALAFYKGVIFPINLLYRKLVYPYTLFHKVNRLSDLPLNSMYSDLDAIVVSTGGVATTTVMQFLSLYVRVNDPHDRDLLKHIHSDSVLNALGSKKVIFIYGNNRDACISLLKRGWLTEQCIKLGGKPNILDRHRLLSEFDQLADLQINLFKKRSESLDILLLHYDELWENIDNMKNFLNINDPEFSASFPKKRSRNDAPY